MEEFIDGDWKLKYTEFKDIFWISHGPSLKLFINETNVT